MRAVDKKRTHVARVLHGAGVDHLNDLFAYDPAAAAAGLYPRPRHAKATAIARKRRQIVRASRRANRP